MEEDQARIEGIGADENVSLRWLKRHKFGYSTLKISPENSLFL